MCYYWTHIIFGFIRMATFPSTIEDGMLNPGSETANVIARGATARNAEAARNAAAAAVAATAARNAAAAAAARNAELRRGRSSVVGNSYGNSAPQVNTRVVNRPQYHILYNMKIDNDKVAAAAAAGAAAGSAAGGSPAALPYDPFVKITNDEMENRVIKGGRRSRKSKSKSKSKKSKSKKSKSKKSKKSKKSR